LTKIGGAGSMVSITEKLIENECLTVRIWRVFAYVCAGGRACFPHVPNRNPRVADTGPRDGERRFFITERRLDKTYRVLYKTYRVLYKTYRVLYKTYRVLYKTYRVLFKTYRVLFKTYRVLFKTYRVLFKTYRVLFKAYRVLYKTYRVLYKAYRVLYKTYRVLFKAYRVLFKVYRVLDKCTEFFSKCTEFFSKRSFGKASLIFYFLSLSFYDFYKALGYAAQYAYQNRVDMHDMTVTIVATRHPRELLEFFRGDQECTVTEESPEIYRIAGYRLGIQVIETKKLAAEDNLWLKGLGRGLNAETAGSIIEASRGKYGPDIAAYLHAVLLTNAQIIEEAVKMGKTEETTLDEVLERMGLVAKWKSVGEAIGEARGKQTAWEKFISLMEQGYTVDQLKRMAPSSDNK
jgi:hypothetical protein